MQQDFAPIFPRSVSRGKFRLPLTHEGTEALGLRADRLYQQCPLIDAERASLIKAYSGLKTVDRSTAAEYVGRPLDATHPLPLEPWRGDGIVGEIIRHNVSYCERVRAFVEALEKKYGLSPVTHLQADDGL